MLTSITTYLCYLYYHCFTREDDPDAEFDLQFGAALPAEYWYIFEESQVLLEVYKSRLFITPWCLIWSCHPLTHKLTIFFSKSFYFGVSYSVYGLSGVQVRQRRAQRGRDRGVQTGGAGALKTGGGGGGEVRELPAGGDHAQGAGGAGEAQEGGAEQTSG
jgi:hypothetical protein